MTGMFELYIKRPKKGEVYIPSSAEESDFRFPDKDDTSKFDFEHLTDVELPDEVWKALEEWWWRADFCEEFIIRCDVPV